MSKLPTHSHAEFVCSGPLTSDEILDFRNITKGFFTPFPQPDQQNKPGIPASSEFVDTVATTLANPSKIALPIHPDGFRVCDAVPASVKRFFGSEDWVGVGTPFELAGANSALLRIGSLCCLPTQPKREELS